MSYTNSSTPFAGLSESNLVMGTVLFGDLWVCCSYLTGAKSSCHLGKAHNVANAEGAWCA